MHIGLIAPVSSYGTRKKQHKVLLILIAVVHLVIILAIINLKPKTQVRLESEKEAQGLLVLMFDPRKLHNSNDRGAKQREIGTANTLSNVPTMALSKKTNRLPQSINSTPSLKSQSIKLNEARQAQELDRENTRSNIDHHIPELTKQLERDLAQEERKNEAAKPPNQLVREYWEKQNHPYQTKWQALAANIEKAAVPRGTQEESYTLDDGSRITKINGVCYKAPDPGREYLGQAEVRRVFCPRH